MNFKEISEEIDKEVESMSLEDLKNFVYDRLFDEYVAQNTLEALSPVEQFTDNLKTFVRKGK